MFFLYIACNHRDLHSFPTRRSSDLATHIGVATDHVVESFRNDLYPGYKTSEGVAPELHLDRKSTRLNSSHRCISYAVFCLKKKNLYRHSYMYIGNMKIYVYYYMIT